MASTKSGRAAKAAKPRRTSANGKSSSSRSTARRGQKNSRLPQVLVATSIALAVMLFLPILMEGVNPFFASARRLLEQQMGLGAYIAPVLLLALAGLLALSLRQRGYKLHWSRAVGWIAFFAGLLGVLGCLHTLGVVSGGDIAAGGYFGSAFYHAVAGAFGYAGALLVLLTLTIGGAAAGFGLPVSRARAAWRAFSRACSASARFAKRSALPALGALAKQSRSGAKASARFLAVASTSAAGAAGQLWSRLTTAVGEAAKTQVDAVAPAEGAAAPIAEAPPTQATAGVKAAPKKDGGSAPTGDAKAPAAYQPGVARGAWQLPPLELLEVGPEPEGNPLDDEERLKTAERIIEKTLADFGVPVKVIERRPGPTVTQFGVEPQFHEKRARDGTVLRREKVKVREITARATDLALALAARSIRIEAPVPGRPVVGIEVPNQAATVVTLRAELESRNFQRVATKYNLPIVMGRDVAGEVVTADLAKMPHLLIAGATGAGKSVCINSIIAAFLMNRTPDELRFLMVDPKRVELTMYDAIPHLLRPVVVDIDKAVPALFQAVTEMDRRYREFASLGVRNIEGYNRLATRDGTRQPLPYLVPIIDELADLMMLAADEVERTLCRLAQLARATGIHLVVATQRPSVDVITG
ncbi:MAG: DNA translocase FtsK, partial [Dehalococcoidales bacterium]|nr:DNA translocase FtsK [Dehalococcoidales bacterium]